MPDFRDYAHGKGTAMFLAHSGKGHDDNPPGRGSGRYPFGSGKRPFQHGAKEKLKKQKYKNGASVYYNTTENSQMTSENDYNWVEVDEYENANGETFYQQAARAIKDGDGFNYTPDYNYSMYDVEEINPDFGSPGTTNNCSKCTVALELRKRGYDVAAGRQNEPTLSNSFETWFKNPEKNVYGKDNLVSELEKQGKGASGTLSMRYEGGSGHVIHYDVLDDGKVRFEDGQCGRVYDPGYDDPYKNNDYTSLDDFFDSYAAIDYSKGFTSYRLDNAEVNWDELSNDSVIRGRKINNKVFNRKTNQLVDTW